MTGPSIRFGDAIAAVTAALQASAALDGVTISEGATPTADFQPRFIIVGHDGNTDSDGSLSDLSEAGAFDMQLAAMGDVQQEDGTVNVVAVSTTGDTQDLAGRVTDVQALVAACSDACSALVTGDPGSQIVFAPLVRIRVMTRQIGQGCAVFAIFAVPYSTPWA